MLPSTWHPQPPDTAVICHHSHLALQELSEGEKAVRRLVQSMQDATATREACVALGVMVRENGELACEVDAAQPLLI